jgi:hypothetical protein
LSLYVSMSKRVSNIKLDAAVNLNMQSKFEGSPYVRIILGRNVSVFVTNVDAMGRLWP